MTRGYRSRFQDLINVWTMPATMLCTGNSFTVSHKLKMLYMCKTFVPLFSGHTSYKSEVVIIITATNSNIYKYFIIVRLRLCSFGILCSDYTEY
jgi:hypothetical protein